MDVRPQQAPDDSPEALVESATLWALATDEVGMAITIDPADTLGVEDYIDKILKSLEQPECPESRDIARLAIEGYWQRFHVSAAHPANTRLTG